MIGCEISIIVPVYNVEKYIDECISSILSQSFVDFELLLVNDGSTDNSGLICDKYACLDPRVQSIHIKNQGVSVARNIGLRRSTGKYIFFIDPDDFLLDNALYTLHNAIQASNTDIVRGEYIRINNDGDCIFKSKKKQKTPIEDISVQDFFYNILEGEYYLWVMLFRKSIIQGLSFTEGRIYLEDLEFLCKLLLKNPSIRYVPSRVYAYRQRLMAVSNQANEKKIRDIVELSFEFRSLSQSATNPQSKILALKSVQLYLSALRMVAYGGFYDHRSYYCNKYNFQQFRRVTIKNLHWSQAQLYNPLYWLSPVTSITLLSIIENLRLFKQSIKNLF